MHSGRMVFSGSESRDKPGAEIPHTMICAGAGSHEPDSIAVAQEVYLNFIKVLGLSFSIVVGFTSSALSLEIPPEETAFVKYINDKLAWAEKNEKHYQELTRGLVYATEEYVNQFTPDRWAHQTEEYSKIRQAWWLASMGWIMADLDPSFKHETLDVYRLWESYYYPDEAAMKNVRKANIDALRSDTYLTITVRAGADTDEEAIKVKCLNLLVDFGRIDRQEKRRQFEENMNTKTLNSKFTPDGLKRVSSLHKIIEKEKRLILILDKFGDYDERMRSYSSVIDGKHDISGWTPFQDNGVCKIKFGVLPNDGALKLPLTITVLDLKNKILSQEQAILQTTSTSNVWEYSLNNFDCKSISAIKMSHP